MHLRSIVLVPATLAAFTLSALGACSSDTPANPPARDNGNGSSSSTSSGASDVPDDNTSSSSGSSGKPADAGPDAAVLGKSGVEAAKTTGSLSTAEKKKFCDWLASINGGYGKSTSCDAGDGGGLSIAGPKDQVDCVQNMPPGTCAAKVSELEACMQRDADDPCSLALVNAPECEPLKSCQ